MPALRPGPVCLRIRRDRGCRTRNEFHGGIFPRFLTACMPPPARKALRTRQSGQTSSRRMGSLVFFCSERSRSRISFRCSAYSGREARFFIS